MKTLSVALFLCALLGAGSPAAAQESVRTTGLDATQPLNSVMLDVSDTTIDAGTREVVRSAAVRIAPNAREEFEASFPYRMTLSIDGVGTAQGPGDAAVRFMHVLGSRGRWRQAAGASLSFATGAPALTSGTTNIAPFYALSYAPREWAALVVSPSYAVSTTVSAGYPVTQTLSLNVEAIAVLPRNFYAAAALTQAKISGTYRYTQRLARFTIGNVFSGRYNVSAYFQLPAADNFTYTHVEQRAVGMTLSVQRP